MRTTRIKTFFGYSSLKGFFAERSLKRNKRIEFTLFPRRRGINFGWDATRNNAVQQHVYIGIRYVFNAYLYWKWPKFLCKKGAKERALDVAIDLSHLYVKWGRDRMFEARQPHLIYNWPWKYELVSHEWLSLDLYTGKIVHDKLAALIAGNEPEEVPANWVARRPYSYVFQKSRNGPYSKQETEATYHIERHTWRRGCIPFYRQHNLKLRISFQDEMGPGRGSWKGGTVGISWPMQKGEDAHAAFERFTKSDYRFR